MSLGQAGGTECPQLRNKRSTLKPKHRSCLGRKREHRLPLLLVGKGDEAGECTGWHSGDNSGAARGCRCSSQGLPRPLQPEDLTTVPSLSVGTWMHPAARVTHLLLSLPPEPRLPRPVSVGTPTVPV